MQHLPLELQVRTLSYLRAVDLSAVHQVNRYCREATSLHHAIVVYCAEQVYPAKWTRGFENQPISSSEIEVVKTKGKTKGKGRSSSFGSFDETMARTKPRSSSIGSIDGKLTESGLESQDTISTEPQLYTFEHLRNMELLVVVRVLSSPEPTTGYVVSKSWCKTALCWLEGQQERIYQQQQHHQEPTSTKKKAKKAKAKQRKSSTAEAPPPNVNSDITCAHDQLQHYTSTKSARARRRLLDKQAWKILKVLYPESTPLPAVSGECLLCRAEAYQQEKLVVNQQEAAKQQRKLPLRDPAIRRFYTRTRGVPEACLHGKHQLEALEDCGGEVVDAEHHSLDVKLPAATFTTPVTPMHSKNVDYDSMCPLVDGTYYILPRAWCHGWRRFVKTGEGGSSPCTFPPPDASGLLCDAHRLALIPPHLEAFLYGKSSQLLEGSKTNYSCSHVASSSTLAALPPGQGPTQESIQAMISLGLSEGEISRQLSAMRSIEAQQQRLRREVNVAVEDASAFSRNEMLDRENHAVVEILTEAEVSALAACWPGCSGFSVRFTVRTGEEVAVAAATGDSLICGGVNFCTPVCRSCDATGLQCSVTIKSRTRVWVKKSAEKARAPASLEY